MFLPLSTLTDVPQNNTWHKTIEIVIVFATELRMIGNRVDCDYFGLYAYLAYEVLYGNGCRWKC